VGFSNFVVRYVGWLNELRIGETDNGCETGHNQYE
jgi:hypothetical protein